MRALFLSTNTAQAAAVRYRILQFFPLLEAGGIECVHKSLFDAELDATIYRPGNTRQKLVGVVERSLARIWDSLNAWRYDVVVLLREALLVGPPVIEALFRVLGRPIVFDIDDAVWESYDSPTYGKLARWVKCAWKAHPIMRLSAAVTAGNAYLAEHVRRYNPNVTIIPTVVDTELYRPRLAPAAEKANGPLVLGWIGSHSTFRYFQPLLPVLDRLAAEADFVVRLVGSGTELESHRFALENLPWRLEREIDDVRSFDIGLFPVVDEPWARGKSAFKAVQYGAVGIPTVASPVTTNCDVIVDGATGLLAESPDQWHAALLKLIRERELRHALGAAARTRIEASYSLASQAPRFAAIIARAATR